MARRWLLWVDDKLDGELFKVHSRGKWVWPEPRPHKQLKAGETVSENVCRNGYLRAESLEGAWAEIVRRAGRSIE
jgi:hypothetical protein